MIGMFLTNVIFNLVVSFLDLTHIGEWSWSISESTLSTFMSCVRAVLYFLPVDTISRIVFVIIGLGTFRVMIRLLRTLWDILPIV